MNKQMPTICQQANELLGHYTSKSALAVDLQTPRTNLIRILEGQEPKHGLGERIAAIHRLKCGVS